MMFPFGNSMSPFGSSVGVVTGVEIALGIELGRALGVVVWV